MYRSPTILVLCIAALAACGDDDTMLSADSGVQDSGAPDSEPSDAGGNDDTGTSVDAGPVEDAGASSDFIVTGISGENVLLDRLWDRGCVPGANGNDWTMANRILTGLELTFTLVDYQNGSETPDCETGRVGQATFTVMLTDDEVQVPIVWVDPAGEIADPPMGLEGVTTANGATALMSAATITPETEARADQLNGAMFCGAEDWAPGVGRDAVECLTGGFNPFKGTIVVDDRELPWKIYDGVGTMFDEMGYPIDMPNYLPHSGPFPVP